MTNIREKIGNTLLFRDGAMGTMLLAAGLKAGEYPESWNFSHPDVLLALHKSYLDAGADIIMSNTFGANSVKLKGTGISAFDAVREGVRLAKSAVADCGRDAYVGLDIGSTGKLLMPYGELSFDAAYDAFAEVCEAGCDADIIMIETMSDIYEAKAALLAAKEHSSLPVAVTLTFGEDGKLLTGADILTSVAVLEGLGADMIGMNCGLGPDEMLKLLPVLRENCSVPIAIIPNAGLPEVEDGNTVYRVSPSDFAKDAKLIVEGGAALIGGCCGTTPEHIQAVRRLCNGMEIISTKPKHRTLVASYTHTVEFSSRPLIIGERINPTGKKAVKQALREDDMDFLCREAIAQTDAGAHILDVNVGLPEIDETVMMEKAILAVQSVCDTPLQIDTSDPAAMERALRIYNGKALINSVNGKEESMSAVLPLAKKYGACVAALTLDESGIPETAAQRIAIAEKILKRAEEYGLSKSDLIFDALTMTISTGGNNANVALDTIDHIRNTMGCHTVLGVSNISFGLPSRETLNSAFFTLALGRGLSAGIINPMNAAMSEAYLSYCALRGIDEGSREYIEVFSAEEKSAAKVTVASDMTLHTAIVKGLAAKAAELAEAALLKSPPIDVIDGEIIPALDEVGAGFENKTVYLPQLLMAADAAKAAFDVIKLKFSNEGKRESKGKIVLATVKGDIHDIGKNILKTLLENYGFDVIDLGKDVEPSAVTETVKRENVRLVGLSALMTTTVANMKITIDDLRRECPDCKIMVGGAVLTNTYAHQIGADFYSKEAMGAVRYAEEFFKN